jgi:cob(I)alamin adenosyltransferase
LIQVYTGNGKGKSTAAFGQALRANGAGLKVYICQFLKGKKCCDATALNKLKNVKAECFGKKCFIRKSPDKEDIESAERALEAANKAVGTKKYDMVILDEINVAIHLGIIRVDDILLLIKGAPRKVEFILTGRNAHPDIVKIADLVSEIREVKHYFRKGLKARRGIEY